MLYAGYPHTTDARGVTLLMVAAANGHTGLVALLLERGLKADARNNNGTTALMAAAGKR